MDKIISCRGGKRVITKCVICKKEMSVKKNVYDKNKTGFSCSPECRLKYQQTIGVERVIKAHKENFFNVRVGSGLTTDGYVWIYAQGKPKNQIKVHRYLMEIKIGRELRDDEIVHHKDGNKLNNHIDNLEIVNRVQHNKIHNHLGAEKRNDCYTEEELKDILNFSTKEFLTKYPNRTRMAIYQKKHKLKNPQY